MISKMAWNAFKKTGDINTFLEFVETKNIEKGMLEKKREDKEEKERSEISS